MNLYKYLMQDAHSEWNNGYPMTERQLKFIDDLIKDIPLIPQYLHDSDGDYFFVVPDNNRLVPTLSVGVKRTPEDNSWYNMFCVFDKPIDEWGWGVLDRRNMGCDEDVDLQPIVKNWCIEYEKKVLRENKLKRILSKSEETKNKC